MMWLACAKPRTWRCVHTLLVHPAAIPQQQHNRQQHYSRVVKGLNIMKTGEDPSTGPDHEYPDWLFDMLKPLPTLRQLEKEYRADENSLPREMVRAMMCTYIAPLHVNPASAYAKVEKPGYDQGQQRIVRKELGLVN